MSTEKTASNLAQIHSSLTEQGAAFKRARDEAAQAVAVIDEKIETLEAEVDAIRSAPLNCKDFCDLICADVDRLAQRGRGRLASMVLSQAERSRDARNGRTGYWLWRESFNFGGNVQSLCLHDASMERVVCMAEPSRVGWEGNVDFIALCGLFPEAIKKAIVETLAAQDWPFKDAQPIATRQKRLAAIEKEVDALKAERAGLQAAIDQYAELA